MVWSARYKQVKSALASPLHRHIAVLLTPSCSTFCVAQSAYGGTNSGTNNDASACIHSAIQPGISAAGFQRWPRCWSSCRCDRTAGLGLVSRAEKAA